MSKSVDLIDVDYKDLGPIKNIRLVKSPIVSSDLVCLDKIAIDFESYVMILDFDVSCSETKFITTDFEEDLVMNLDVGKTINDIKIEKLYDEENYDELDSIHFRHLNDNHKESAFRSHKYVIVYDDLREVSVDLWCNNGYYFSPLRIRVRKIE